MRSKPSAQLFTCHYCHKQFPDEMTLPILVNGRVLSMCEYCDEQIRESRDEMREDDPDSEA